MQTLKNRLKKIDSVTLRTPDPVFRDNLRKRLINEFEAEYHSENIDVNLNNRRNFGGFLNTKWGGYSILNLGGVFAGVFAIFFLTSYYLIPGSSLNSTYVNNKAQVEIITEIEGGEVYINGKYVGMAPLKDIELPKGDYEIVVKKENEILYTENLSIDEKVNPNTKLIADVTKDSQNIAIYKNSNLGIKFEYPKSWNVENRKEDSLDIVEFGGDDSRLIIEVGDALEDLEWNESIQVYAKDLNVGDAKYKRYIWFTETGDFVDGIISIHSSEVNPSMRIRYDLQGQRDYILGSDKLSNLDNLVANIVFDNTQKGYINFDGENYSVDFEGEVLAEDTSNEILQTELQNEAEIKLSPYPSNSEINYSATYTNDLYGYTIKYLEGWALSKDRADYPANEIGHKIRVDGKSYNVAMLGLYKQDSKITLIMTSDNISIVNAVDNVCINSDEIVGNAGKYGLVESQSETKHLYQFCDSGRGEMTFNSEKNGIITYSIFVDTNLEDPTEVLEESMKIVKTLSFSDKLVKNVIDQIKYGYTNEDIGFSFDYPHSWNMYEYNPLCNRETGEKCREFSFIDESDNSVLQISTDLSEAIYSGRLIEEDKTISIENGPINIKEYYKKECSDIEKDSEIIEICENKFQFGEYRSSKLTIKYYTQDYQILENLRLY